MNTRGVRKMRWVIGIDEVGRGALAGPVVVAAALVPVAFNFKTAIALGTLKDSKKLTAAKREVWAKYFRADSQIKFAVARVYPRQIEKKNISKAANLAAKRALERLERSLSRNVEVSIFLDGGLFVGNGERPRRGRTVIKGDEKIPAVAAASIIAKVTRDRFMQKLSKKHPEYGFEIHKGYGTKSHREAIMKTGPSAAHRLTFLH